MPRLPRVEVEGAVYYVTSRGSSGFEIFKDAADYQAYVELLAKYKTQHKFKLFAFCLLPDRLYLLIETGLPAGQAGAGGASLSEIMHDLNSLYTKHFNSRYKRHGHLFEARFKSVLVEKARFLPAMTRHIHKAAGFNFKEHPYSSIGAFIAGGAATQGLDLSAEAGEVKTLLRDADPAAYEKYCLNDDQPDVKDLEKRLRRASILGSADFETKVQDKIHEHSQVLEKAAKQKERARRMKIVLAVVAMGVLAATGSSVYLYIEKNALETQYKKLLETKEAQFLEQARFENVSPIALQELENTQWEIELLPITTDKTTQSIIKDTIQFKNDRFWSKYFSRKESAGSSFFISRRGDGSAIWGSFEVLPDGSKLTWRGDWRGDIMRGVVSFRPDEGSAEPVQDYSFFSVKWEYV